MIFFFGHFGRFCFAVFFGYMSALCMVNLKDEDRHYITHVSDQKGGHKRFHAAREILKLRIVLKKLHVFTTVKMYNCFLNVIMCILQHKHEHCFSLN